MKKANILVARNRDRYLIKVEGRATFECSAPLRNLVKNINPQGVKDVSIDLSSCSGMDSTFMGVLTMMGLRVLEMDSTVIIEAASEANQKLLNGLGLRKVFIYHDQADSEEVPTEDWVQAEQEETGNKEKAELVLDAHKTLMDTDVGNVQKFEKVVDLVKKDLDKKELE